MPRPFLGQSNSQTGPQRSRLQGGVPQSGSSGPIAEGGLQAPALQALQQIVSTFQSPGRTNLGGSTEIPAAPRLQTPERTPTPQLPQAFEISKPVLGALTSPISSNGSSAWTDLAGMSVTVTPNSASSRFLVSVRITICGDNDGTSGNTA